MPPAALPLYRSPALRVFEAAHADHPLMARAGAVAAAWAEALADGGRILVLAGPGNNGGDAFVVAEHLRARHFEVSVVFPGTAEKLPADAAAAYRRFVAAGGRSEAAIPTVARWHLIVDGLFGIGLTRAPGGAYATLIEAANALAVRDACPLVALDVPSGLDADTGRTFAPCIRATHTLSFIGAKPGLYTADGPDHCGEIRIAGLDLGFDAAAPVTDPKLKLDPPAGHLIAPALFADRLVPRRRNTHKGSYGSACIVGGAPGMLGAALLAGRAALHLGCGRVHLGLIDPDAPRVDLQQPELMLRRADDLFANDTLAADLTALAVGPGLGRSDAAREPLERALDAGCDLPLLLDADALNLIAADGELAAALGTRSAPVVLTPHPAEAARLLGCGTAEVQADRVAAALELAARHRATVVLKGCGSVVATPAGEWFINTSGNPGLATAGSGDVLSGLAVALLAQGWPATDAALAAVHLHGLAAERLAAAGIGPTGLTAGETIAAARAVFNAWLSSPSFFRDVPCHPESSASCCSSSRSCSSPSSTPARNT